MIKISAVILTFLLTNSLFAQDLDIQEIEVLGVGKMTTNADFATVIISLTSGGNDRDSVIKDLNRRSETVRKELLDYGLNQDQIRLTNFDIGDNYQYGEPDSVEVVSDENRYWGYRGVIIKFSFEYDFMAKLTDKLASHSPTIYFKYGFELSEKKKEKVRKALIEKALADAKTKAEIIADSYKVKLKRIKKIRYGAQTFTPNIQVNTVELATESISTSVSKVVDSPSIDYSETVEVIWEFEQINVR